MSALSPTAAYFGGLSPLSPSPVRIRSYSSVACYEEDGSTSPVLPAGHLQRHPSASAAGSSPLVRYGRAHSARTSPYGSTTLESPLGPIQPCLSLTADRDGDNLLYEVSERAFVLPPPRHMSLTVSSYARSRRSGSSSSAHGGKPNASVVGPAPLRRRDILAGEIAKKTLPHRSAVAGAVSAVRRASLRLTPTTPHRAPPLTLVGHARSEASPTSISSQRNELMQDTIIPALRRHSDRSVKSNSATAKLPRRKLPEVPRQNKISNSSEDDGRPQHFEDFLRFGRVSDETLGTRSATRASVRLARTSLHSRDTNFLDVLPVAYRKTSENNLAISHYRNSSNNSVNFEDNNSQNNKRKSHKKSVASFDFSLFTRSKNDNNVDCLADGYDSDDDNRNRNTSNYNSMGPPPRSQSFRHRTRPMTLGGAMAAPSAAGGGESRRQPLGELGERRRSTPTIHRRSSLQQKTRTAADRTDVWPEPKQMSEIEERFLRLPDSEDYTRVRQFKIDSKGAVVSRGDSFRRKRHANVSQSSSCNFDNRALKNDSSLSPFPISDTDSVPTGRQTLLTSGRTAATANSAGGTTDSRSTSVSSNDSAGIANKVAKSSPSSALCLWDGVISLPTTEDDSFVIEDAPSTSAASYKVYVVGQSGAGKSSLIRQFISSEYRNAFADEIEEMSNATTVSVNIGGFECELNFFESDPNMDPFWIEEPVAAYLLVYNIDRKSSFKTVVNALETIRSKRKSVPVILAGNKVDLERKRTVSAHEVKCVALTYDVVNFEISVALNHDVDDLLVGIVAEIKESIRALDKSSASGGNSVRYNDENSAILPPKADNSDPAPEPEEFRAAIRRFSQRKKRQMGAGNDELEGGKCASLNPVGLFEKFRQWRRGMSKC